MRKLLFLFSLLLIGVSWLAWSYRVHLVSETLTRSLGVTTQVQDVELSTHGVILRGFSLGASNDSTEPPALAVDSIRVAFKPWNWWNNPVRISELSIDGVYLMFDLSSWQGFGKNWASVVDHLTSQRHDTPVETNDETRYIVDQVVITNVYVSLEKRSTPGLRASAPAVARFELHDVGSQSPRSLPQTVQLLLGATLEQVTALHPGFHQMADRVVREGDAELQKVMKSIKAQQQETTSMVEGAWKRVRSWFDWNR